MKVIHIYEQVRDYIAQDAKQGIAGDVLPNEIAYAKLLEVSRPTVRKAVQELVQSGLVTRLPGKGLVIGSGSPQSPKSKLLFALPFSSGDGFLFKILTACIQSANELGYSYKIINEQDPKTRYHLIRAENPKDFKACLLTAYDSPYDTLALQYLETTETRILLLDNTPDFGHYPVIACDDFKGGYMVAEYLIKKGHTHILYITSTRKVQTVRDRLEGFRQAFKRLGAAQDSLRFIEIEDQGQNTAANSFAQMDCGAYIKEHGITAICGYSSLPVIAFCNRLVLSRFRIPEDISVIGYGDYSIITANNVPIATIKVPAETMGKTAIQRIDDALTAKERICGVKLPLTLDKLHTVKDLTRLG